MNTHSRCLATLPNMRGQSLIEVLIAVAIGVIIILAVSALIVPAIRANRELTQIQTSSALAKELLDNVRVITESNWHSIVTAQDGNLIATGTLNFYYLTTSTSPFLATSGVEEVQVATTTYARYFYIEDVCRVGDNIVGPPPPPQTTCPSGIADPSTKKITVVYGWSGRAVSMISQYFTRFRNQSFIQTDWSGGADPAQNPTTSSTNKFFSSSVIDHGSTTGSIILNGF